MHLDSDNKVDHMHECKLQLLWHQLPAALHVMSISNITRLLLALAGFEDGWLG